VVGTLAVLALLPGMSLIRTIPLAVGTIVVAALPVAMTIIGGQTVGATPDVLRNGLASASGARLTDLVIVLGVMVTHRLSVVHLADLIVVLDHGRVLEVGNHQQPLAAFGLDAGLFELQARSNQ
jgi:hypothetical protein